MRILQHANSVGFLAHAKTLSAKLNLGNTRLNTVRLFSQSRSSKNVATHPWERIELRY